VQIVFTLLCSADHIIFIPTEHLITVFVLVKWDRHSPHGDWRFSTQHFSKNLANNYIVNVTGTSVICTRFSIKIYNWQAKVRPKNTRKTFRSAHGLAALANSSLATTVGPGGEISLVTLRDFLAERSGDQGPSIETPQPNSELLKCFIKRK